jgi:2-dehydro-3-deoxyglucarate aldolase/4-hydroxy-2-oxoheptanedioate aldolase
MKNKIKLHQKTVGMHVNLNDIAVSRIAGLAGYDFIWVDLEHSYISLENLMAHVIAIQAGGTAVIVRVPQNDLTFTKKVLEMGVDGIIFPMVRTAEEANELIASTLYPPYGTRGFGPMNAIRFGFDDAKAYTRNTKDHLCRFIQIEHVEAVENLEKIMENEYIDGYIFGPNDLSGSIGELCEVFEPGTTELIERSVQMLKKAGKYVGLSTGDTTTKTLTYWADFGIDMLSAGADYGFLQEAAVNNRLNLERVMQASKDTDK